MNGKCYSHMEHIRGLIYGDGHGRQDRAGDQKTDSLNN